MTLDVFKKREPLFLALATLLMANAQAATLNGFDIQSDRQNIQIILHTTERATYRTETEGRNFSVILSESQLSHEQVKNGFPVVVDKQNRWIGRATPLGNNQVKVSIPNLPANQYSISVVQQKASPSPGLQLRPAVPETTEDLETLLSTSGGEVSKNLLRPAAQGIGILKPTEKASMAAIPGRSQKQAVSGHRHRRIAAFPNSRTIASKPKATTLVAIHQQAPTVATAASTPQSSAPPLIRPQSHVPSVTPITQAGKKNAPPKWTPLSIPTAASGLPFWAMLVLSVILGGVGLLALTSFGLILRRMKRQVQRAASPVEENEPFPVFSTSELAGKGLHDAWTSQPSRKATGAKVLDPIEFLDKPLVNASDYLLKSPTTLAEAVGKTIGDKYAPTRTLSQRRK